MKSGQHRDEVVRKEKVIGFEMEGAGVWDNVPCIIIKGVCDYADSHKSKSWQIYAAATGTSVTKAFLEYWAPINHKGQGEKLDTWWIPFGRNPRFVGRQKEISELEDMITMPDGAKKLAITGLGGVGKTQIALELAYRMRDREPDCSIFWIPCTSYEAVEQVCMAIAEVVGIRDAKPAEVKQRLKNYLSKNDKRWLLIFDNADDTEMWTKGSNNTPPVRDFLSFNTEGHVIFTTRNRELAVDLASSHVREVRELDKKTGLEFLEKSLPKNLLHDSHAAITLLEQLAFLSLAIAQATAYIQKKGIAVAGYLMLLEEQETDVMEPLSKDFGDDQRYNDLQNPVVMTWLISFDQIQKLDGLAAEYLSLMACVDPRNIPQPFFHHQGPNSK
ncbi:P-loop containing nucleoside triphosphate hydrolase protein [Aspergillus desertorum]